MNVTDIKGQVMKSMPTVALPVEWVESIAWAKSVVTCDRAMAIYSRAWTATKWTARATWTITLVLIGLVMLAVQAWQNRQQVKESVLVIRDRGIAKAKQLAKLAKDKAFWAFFVVRNEGEAAFDSKVVAPATAMRDRMKNAFNVMVQGKEI